MLIDDDFPARLLALRGERGLSQNDLAEKAGMAATQLSRYESGKSKPRAEIVAKIARALDVSIQYLANGDLQMFGPTFAPAINLRLPEELFYLVKEASARTDGDVQLEIILRLEESFRNSISANDSRHIKLLEEIVDLQREKVDLLQAQSELLMALNEAVELVEEVEREAEDPEGRRGPFISRAESLIDEVRSAMKKFGGQ